MAAGRDHRLRDRRNDHRDRQAGVDDVFRSIVVGTDGSQTADEAVRQAAALARILGARVHLVCVYETGADPAADADARRSGDGWAAGTREGVDATLARSAAVLRAEGVKVDLYPQRGDPADAILDVAEERDADLIVIGNRGRTGAKRFLLGSVPNRISHHAPCAVLIIRTA
jgi:nucleotide-binding universal stress UspA family protein